MKPTGNEKVYLDSENCIDVFESCKKQNLKWSKIRTTNEIFCDDKALAGPFIVI